MDAETVATALDRGRAAYARRAWRAANEQLSRARSEAELAPEDLERLAMATVLIGRDAEGTDLMTAAHQAYLQNGRPECAVRCAYWLAHGLAYRGEFARAGGWIARAQRMLDEGGFDCVERGYLLTLPAVQATRTGDAATGYRLFSEAGQISARFGDRTLDAMARHGQARALIKLGEVAKGVTLLDETMVAIEAGDVHPVVAGLVYCSMIDACNEIFDLQRAQEWTSSLTRWCEAQPDLVPFRGVCLVHRAELMQLQGDWSSALSEARHAREQLSDPPPPLPAVGSALYQEAELHRLRGDFADAEAAYRESGKYSRRVRPGMAQLRLARGDAEAALSAIRLLLDEAQGNECRPQVLSAAVDIAIAANDIEAARAASRELSEIAETLRAPQLCAMADHASGALLLAEGNARAAITALRRATTTWQELHAPYEAARARVLLSAAARKLGDDDLAALELDAARSVFEQVGARPDLKRMNAAAAPAPATECGLTARELQVLRLVAQGKPNKVIAQELFISEKTVHRHLSNIFLKLDLSSRAAATAYAFQHGLV